MLYLKACPRCHGDMHPESDRWGEWLVCMNCGHEQAILLTPPFGLPVRRFA